MVKQIGYFVLVILAVVIAPIVVVRRRPDNDIA